MPESQARLNEAWQKKAKKIIKDEGKKAKAAKTQAAKKGAETRAANRLKRAAAAGRTGAAQRALGASALRGFASRYFPALGIGTIVAEIGTELKREAKDRPVREARQAEVAKKVTAKAPKNVREAKPGQSPTDMLRAASKGREVLAPAQRAGSRYTVKSGDTLSEIAKAKGTTVRAIMKASGIENANKIRVGQKIIIPDDVKRKGPYGKITKKEMKSGNYNTSKTPKFGKEFKKGGSISKPRGCGAAQRGYGKAMMCGGHMKGKK
jgi:LysM repeat protein